MKQSSYQSGLLFTRAHTAVREHIYVLLSKYELTPSYWAVLSQTADAEEGIRLTNVAKQMGVKAPLVTMLAGDLISRGLVNRLPHHSDGRAKLLVTTPKGKKMAQQIEAELNSEIERLMKGVTAANAKAFQKTLQIILSNASAEA